MQPYDVSLMINPPEVMPVTLLLEGSNVSRGDKWYFVLFVFYLLFYFLFFFHFSLDKFFIVTPD